MWLLNTNTLQLREFLPTKIPPYAILSHTWGDEEVPFHDLQKSASKRLQGYKKITKCCALAKSQGYEWVWIDTCCIDKKSSAELSEAINSMFDWYKNSMACYVYLSDVTVKPVDGSLARRTFENSRWFRRGWTLQELLAPNWVKFYDCNWQHIGDTRDLLDQIVQATGIEKRYLLHGSLITSASIAARMSWASRRSTTRPEDEAYCLLGIFNVNLPLLYGEGTKAFRRLQEEIVRTSNDESLFAWNAPGLVTGIFAPNPSVFENSGDIYPALTETDSDRPPSFMTNRGFCIEIRCRKTPWNILEHHDGGVEDKREHGHQFLYFYLNCAQQGWGKRPFSVVLMSKSRPGQRGAHASFVRFHAGLEVAIFEDYKRNSWLESSHCQKVYIQDPS